jgi:hypothetical protein
MPRKSATEVKIDFLVREIKELRNETKCLRADINKGKGAVWVLIIIASALGGIYNFLNN